MVNETTKQNTKVLSDGDVIILDDTVRTIINRCCECGVEHLIKIDYSGNIIRMSWNRIYGEQNG